MGSSWTLRNFISMGSTLNEFLKRVPLNGFLPNKFSKYNLYPQQVPLIGSFHRFLLTTYKFSKYGLHHSWVPLNHIEFFLSTGSFSMSFFNCQKNFLGMDSFMVSPYPLGEFSKYGFLYGSPLHSQKFFFQPGYMPPHMGSPIYYLEFSPLVSYEENSTNSSQ